MSTERKVTKDTSIAEAMELCPGAAQVFDRHGMGCMACLAAGAETIEDGAIMHGVDVQALVDELNACAEGG